VTAPVLARIGVVLPMGTLRERCHRGVGMGSVAINGQHVRDDAGRHFMEDMPV
jgi:hypothetical protein